MIPVEKVAELFAFDGEIRDIKPFGCGHINDTYCVYCEREGKPPVRYILQRINHHVFKNVSQLMENVFNVTEYLREAVIAEGGDPQRECLLIICTKRGAMDYIDTEGYCWRAFNFIENAISYENAGSGEHFYYSGCAFGKFQRLLADYPSETLHETIPNFHNTPVRYETFEKAVAENRSGRAAEVQKEIEFIRARRPMMGVLTDMLDRGELPLRVTHNDTKLNNVMLDDVVGKPVCVIDLDTVMPGLSLYDFGDSIRFGASTAAEDEIDLSKVSCDLDLFAQYTKGYLEECGSMLTANEIRMLAFSARLLTLECGMRFLTDHLDGDVYFKIHRPGHNLDLCRTQLKLVEDMENKAEQMEEIVRRYAGAVRHGEYIHTVQ